MTSAVFGIPFAVERATDGEREIALLAGDRPRTRDGA